MFFGFRLQCTAPCMHAYYVECRMLSRFRLQCTTPCMHVCFKTIQVSLDKPDGFLATKARLSRIRVKEGYFSWKNRIRRQKIVRVIEGPTYRSPTYQGTPVHALQNQYIYDKSFMLHYSGCSAQRTRMFSGFRLQCITPCIHAYYELYIHCNTSTYYTYDPGCTIQVAASSSASFSKIKQNVFWILWSRKYFFR